MRNYLKKNIAESGIYVPGRNKSSLPFSKKLKRPPIQLSSNTSVLGPSPRVTEAITSEISNVRYYPDSTAKSIKDRISKKIGVAPDNLLIGNGSAEIIDIISRAMLHEGDEVIIGDPTFPKYEISSQICNARIIKIKMKNSKHDLDGFLGHLGQNTKIIFIDTPCNPIGSALTKQELIGFIDKVPDNTLVVVDEAYYEFNDPDNYLDYSNYLNKKNVVFMRTFSKAYGIAGLRIGYLIGHHEVVKYINKVREVFNVNSLALIGGLAALDDEEHLIRNLIITEQQKKYLYSKLDELNFYYYKSFANFILINTERDLESVDKFLLNKGIIVRPLTLIDHKSGYIRVTIGTAEENEYFIDALRDLKQVIPKIN